MSWTSLAALFNFSVNYRFVTTNSVGEKTKKRGGRKPGKSIRNKDTSFSFRKWVLRYTEEITSTTATATTAATPSLSLLLNLPFYFFFFFRLSPNCNHCRSRSNSSSSSRNSSGSCNGGGSRGNYSYYSLVCPIVVPFGWHRKDDKKVCKSDH
mgnify:CR=1 FL=1